MSIDPVTLAIASTVIGGIGTAVSTISNMQESSYQAAVAERNAALAEENARRELERSQQEEQDAGNDAAQEIAMFLAERSASGTVLGVGSNQLAVDSARDLSRRDAARLREGAISTAEGQLQQAADQQAEARQYRRRGMFSFLSGATNLGSNYVSGAQSVNKARLGIS